MPRNFCREHLRDPEAACAPGSLRTVVSGAARVLVCCPLGRWQPRKKRCKSSLRAVSIMRPLAHEKCRKHRGRDWKGEGYPLESVDLPSKKTWAIAAGAVLAVLIAWRLVKGKKSAALAPGPRRIVALGDSWTAHGGYLREILSLLQVQPGRETSTGKGFGYTGQSIAVIRSHLREALAERPTDLIVLAGINDLPGGNAEAIKSGLTQLWAAVKAAGVRLIVVKLPPNLGYPSLKGKLPAWEAVNDFIDQAQLPDVVVDASLLGTAQRTLLPQYDSGDHLHANAAGQALLGQQIFAEAFA